MTALPGRADLARSIAPITGGPEQLIVRATRQAEELAERKRAQGGQRAVDEAGLTAVRAAITAYRDGRSLSFRSHAWLALALTSVRVRDDAWARMDPAHRKEHCRLWTDAARRARPGYVAAPASLLAFTASPCRRAASTGRGRSSWPNAAGRRSSPA